MRYELKVLLVNFSISIGVNLIMRPFWFNDIDAKTDLAIFSTTFTIFLLPFLLLLVNYSLSKKYKITSFVYSAIIIVLSVWLSSYFHFINWADSVGSRSNPDGGTEAITSLEKIGGSLFALFFSVIIHFALREKKE